MSKMILYLDMDGVLADFYASPALGGIKREYSNYPEMYEDGFFFNLPLVNGSLEAVNSLYNSNLFDMWILTQPLAESPNSYTEKVLWIKKYFPYLLNKISMTQDKSHLSGKNRILIDDNSDKWMHKWCSKDGDFIHFDESIPSIAMWDKAFYMAMNIQERAVYRGELRFIPNELRAY